MALHQVNRSMAFAGGAMTVGFAALAGAIGESTAKKPLAGGQLSNAGAKVALDRREFGADQGFGHILYLVSYIIQDQNGKQGQKRNTNLLVDRTRAKTTVESDVLVSQKTWLRNRCQQPPR